MANLGDGRPDDRSAYRGCSVVWAEAINQGFLAMLPPNGPNCLENHVDNRVFSMVGAGSYHPGGVNAAFVDGSVRFVTDSVQTNLSGVRPGPCPVVRDNVTMVNMGASPYGVWGAMATINGGESVSL